MSRGPAQRLDATRIEALIAKSLAFARKAGAILLQNNGAPVAGGPFTTLDLLPGLTAANLGGGRASILAAPGGGLTLKQLQNNTPGASGNEIITPIAQNNVPARDPITVGPSGIVFGTLLATFSGDPATSVAGDHILFSVIRDAANQTGAPGGVNLNLGFIEKFLQANELSGGSTFTVTFPFMDTGLVPGSTHDYQVSAANQSVGHFLTSGGNRTCNYLYVTF
jgi:hypothetical protein